ncbi:MAG TPA: hypothetical protein PJ994_13550, partial [Tepidiformaceae bacterium]|nr:hypothetical protein [Tepidiformaceae bacterium]
MSIIVLFIALVAGLFSSSMPPKNPAAEPPAQTIELRDGAYRARQLPPRVPNGARAVVIERDVAIPRQTLGIRDYDHDSDGWAVVGDTGLQKLGDLAGFQVVNGVPRASVNHADGCKVFTPVRLDVVKALQPRPMKVLEHLPGPCTIEEPPFELGSISGVAVIASTVRTERISSGGGAIVTGDGAGKLIIPPTALASEIEISVASIHSPTLPPWVESFRAGFALEPSGLEFGVPASLEIRPSGGLPSHKELVVVGWRNNGGPLELLSWKATADGLGVVVPINHFSGVGVVASSNAALQRMRDQANVSAGVDMGDLTAQINQAIISFRVNNDAHALQLAVALLSAAYDNVIAPKLDISGVAIEQFVPANIAFQSWRGTAMELEVINNHQMPEALQTRINAGAGKLASSASSV